MEEFPDNHLYKTVEYQYKKLGIFEGKMSIWTYLVLLGYLGENIHLVISLYYETTPPAICGQYICLGGIGVAAFVPMLLYRHEILDIASACETLPNLHVPWDVRKKYDEIKANAMNTSEYKIPIFQSSLVISTGATLVVGPILVHFILGKPLRLPFSDTNDVLYLFVVIYICQGTFYVFCTLVYSSSEIIFSVLIHHLKIQYELLRFTISESAENSSGSILKHSIMQHQTLIMLFERVKDVYTKTFTVIYFFLFLSTALTREILLKEKDTTFLLIIVAELGYLAPYVSAMEALMDEMQNFKTSFVSFYDELQGYSKSTSPMIIIAMTRLSKEQDISIYLNGPSINSNSYGSLINATFTYLASGFFIDRLVNNRRE